MGYSIPKTYLPSNISNKDKKIIKRELNRSRKLYKLKKYYTRKPIKSYKYKKSKHLSNLSKIYKINNIKINRTLSKKTGCSIKTLKQIERKGMGAYYSSGSRPNQTAKSWGLARLASAVTGGKSSLIDYNILINGCKKNSKALKLATINKNYWKNRYNLTKKNKKIIGGNNNLKLKEKIIKFERSKNPDKKYMAYIKNLNTNKIRVLHFGASSYEQYKDRTPLKFFSNKNHNDKRRQMNYYSRHSNGITNRKKAIKYEINKSHGYYTPKILSHIYLW
jgi:hypothetical protein